MKNLTKQNFETELLQTDGVALVDFWAPWCGPCRMMGPALEEIDRDYAGRLTVAKVNVDENPRLAGEFGVMSIPTLIIFKDGQPVDRMVGAMPKAALEGKLSKWVG